MAKRKAARGTRKAAKTSSRAKGRSSGRKAAAKAPKTARRPARASAKAKAARRPARASRKAAKPKSSPKATKRAVTKAKAVKAPKKVARRAAATRPRSAPPARARAAVKAAKAVQPRKAPALDRERRTIADEDEMVPMPPSSLDLDRSASAVRSGRRGMQQKFADHTETSPAMTAGDIDADWESAYAVGDEAPGGDNPTPDQDIVDDIGRAVGVQYDDNEELKGADKVAKRDAHRWELDPASSEDWDDRD
jgi:hypothetical protein